MLATYNILPDTTRVWIYQSNRPFADDQVDQVKEEIRAFVESWTSHNRNLKAFGDLLHQRFVILMVDESSADASGCSIDKSVYFLKNLQAKYGVDLFDRMFFSFKDGEEVMTLDRNSFAQAYREGRINDDTLVFDTLVKNKKELDQALLKPLKDSWHKRMV
jgi:hypothetical protein